MKENRLPKQTVLLWQIRIGLIGIILLIGISAFGLLTDWVLIGTAVAAAILVLLIFWYLPRYFKSYEILFPKGAVVINRGVFIKTTHIMPFSRLVLHISHKGLAVSEARGQLLGSGNHAATIAAEVDDKAPTGRQIQHYLVKIALAKARRKRGTTHIAHLIVEHPIL